MNILFLTNLLPYPLDNGGKIKTYTTLKALFNGNHSIDLLCFKETNINSKIEKEELLKICSSVEEVFQRLTTADNKRYMIAMAGKSLFSSLPLSTYKFVSNDMKKEIEGKKDTTYGCIYYDHLPMFVYYPLCKKIWPNAKHILDEHNCEATIMKRNAEITSNLLKKLFMIYETKKVRQFESKSLLSADQTVILSKEDYKMLRKTTGKDFVHSIIPIGVPDRGLKKDKRNSDVLNILFVGTLTWEPNNQGLIWFLDNVLPIVQRINDRYHLYIVGKKPSNEIIEKTENNKHITVTGYVDSVDEYYDKCDCMIVPLFIGSGQRVKLIEAFSKGMPAISTSIGAEGLEYKDNCSILIADNDVDFAEAVNQMRDEKLRMQIKHEARMIYDELYSPEAVENLILLVINQSLGNREE